MGKVPIGRTIAQTLGFMFGRYPAALGVLWLPLLILLTAYYVAFAPFIAEMAKMAHEAALHPHAPQPAPDMMGFQRYAGVLNLAVILALPWMQAGLTKAALGMKRTFPFAYIGVGMDELRLVGANLVIVAVSYAVAFALVFVVLAFAGVGAALIAGGAAPHAGAMLKPWGLLALFGTLAVLLCVAAYFQIRFTFFLAPITVVEKRFGLWASWEMTAGTMWPIVGIILILLLLFVMLEIALVALVGIPIFLVLIQGGLTGPHPLAGFLALKPFLPLSGLLLVLVLPLFLSLQMAPSAFAYRALTGEPGETQQKATAMRGALRE